MSTIHKPSTRSLTNQLALFFTIVSLIIGIVTSAIFSFSLKWSEDKATERRILIDKDYAVSHYQQGQTGVINVDLLTNAYDSIQLIPPNLRPLIQDKNEYLGEIEINSHSKMIYIGNNLINGNNKKIILISNIDSIEIPENHFIIAIAIVFSMVSALLLIFAVVLHKLSQRLISPINVLSEQLADNNGDTESVFLVQPTAAIEFTQFAQHLNHYRNTINTLLKREQAFARYASHELRTPLTIVQGANKLLQRSQKTPFQERQLQRIEHASKQMTAMVDALLSLIRYEKYKETINAREFDEQELQDIIRNNHQQALGQQIPIEVNISQHPMVKATPAIMNMVVGNLLRNAIAATTQGKINIVMNQYGLTILDTGHGPQKVSQASYDGHGLGLLIVEQWCQRYQWQFQLTERASGGCKAKITFMPEPPQDADSPLPNET